MYYWDSSDPYDNSHLIYYCKTHLPMDEFAQGNFFQAHKIVDVCREYIQQCFAQFTYKNTGGEQTVSAYIKKQLANVQQEHAAVTTKKINVLQEIKTIEQSILNEKQALKNGWHGDKDRNTLYSFREKNDRDIGLLQRAFANTKDTNPEKYTALQDVFEKFVGLASQIDYANLQTLEKQYHDAKKERSALDRTLSWKSNPWNIEQQIKDIETGVERHHVQESIRKDLLRSFKKLDHLWYIVDTRDLQEMFVSIMTTDLIVDCKTDKEVKKKLIKNHTDKIGLFDHIWRIYRNGSSLLLEIETWRYIHKPFDRNTIMTERVSSLVKQSTHILEKIHRNSPYFWREMDTPYEELQQQKDAVIQDLVTHLQAILENPEKEWDWRHAPDTKLEKLFQGIYSITETHQFEDYCKQLWNIDVNNYRKLLWVEGKMLMKQIYMDMNTEERNVVSSDYESRGLFEQIEKDVIAQESHEHEKQLSLYNFAPIYNIQWYLELVSDHISWLTKTLSFRQRQRIEHTVAQMLASQGYTDYIDSSKPIAPLTDTEFLQILQTLRWWKELVILLKKLPGNLLPDINQRIVTLQKTTQWDIR